MKIFLLTKEGNNSPKILALSLQSQLTELGIETQIFDGINLLNRLVSLKDNTLTFHFWFWEKFHNYFRDRKILNQIKKADAVVVCECIPNGFWRRLYNVEKLKKITKKPVMFYEAFYLGNAPTQIEALKKNNDPLFERYDAHLFVSPVTEIKTQLPANAFCIGIRAKTWNLKPLPKKELIALVDFAQPGYEAYRQIQIAQLKKAEIQFISLEEKYSIEEIRNIYRKISIFFVQFPEAFGLPILECLCTGAQIFTPDSGWPMSWRLDANPKIHGEGILPNCFTVYNGGDDLYRKLLEFKNNFIPEETPLKIFKDFIHYYPAFYEGNNLSIQEVLKYISNPVLK